MNRHLLAAIVLTALAGLTYIQYQLLVTGVRLEKLRFDQRAGSALRAVADTLNEPGILGDALIARLQMRDFPDRRPDILADSINFLLATELQRRGVNARFTFVLTDQYVSRIVLSSTHFNREKFNFGRYTAPLGHRIIGGCHCETALYLDITNLFTYLLGELRYLVAPSLLCLLALLAGLLLLINTLRKEQKLNALKNDFINNLTHELKTPAFSISLSAKMAMESLRKGDAEKAGKFLQLIENENEKLKNHVEKVLELGSLESARYQLRREMTDMHELIKTVVTGFAPMAEEREARIDLALEANPCTLPVDADHIANAVRNLLDNALKYSPDKPEIELRTFADEKHFHLSVTDKGMGISPEHLKLIFRKFYRVPTGNLHVVKGFGLGLSYVAQIVKAHGGQVEAMSNQGEGTTIRIVLPH